MSLVQSNIYKKYYYDYLESLYDFLVPKKAKKLRLRSDKITVRGKYDYIIADNSISNTRDIQKYFQRIRGLCKKDSRLIITYYNHLWEPILKFASVLGLRKTLPEQNWVDNNDIENLLTLAGFETITTQKRLLIPVLIPFLSNFINNWFSHLPLINTLCFVIYIVARPKSEKVIEYSVSIIIPARNEEGNIPKIIPAIPKFGLSQEIIFVEGHSTDKTWQKIKQTLEKHKSKAVKIKAFKQRGRGKGDAVRLGFSKATGSVFMIFDADLSVDPKDLTKFYKALSHGLGEFANGSRLVYPTGKDAMRTLNKVGNRIFSWLFTWILVQRFRDTLCGTKALFKEDYKKIKRLPGFGTIDPFGDFDLIFGAIRQNLKVIEVPVKYKSRTYGSTNISRFRHGFKLLKMTALAFLKFRVG